MTITNRWTHYRYLAFRHIGPIGEVSRKHRRAMMFTSILMLFLDPRVSITIGSVSAGGVGIAVEPAQIVPVAFALFIALGYLTVAFWISVLIESGTDRNRAERNAMFEYDPPFEADQTAQDIDQLIRQEARTMTDRWHTRRIGWEVFLPTVLALVALVRFVWAYFW